MKFLASILSTILFGGSCFAAQVPRYVFLFIGDGMSTPQRMMADSFSQKIGNGPLAMNAFPCKTATNTGSANAIVTDSAAAATAIACGEKTNNGMLGVAPDGRRLENVAEVASKRGMKVGIVTTVTVVHATPAAFYAHRANRGDVYRIALDLVSSGFNYFAASGVYDKFDDKKDPEYRGNVFELAAKAGYQVNRNDAAAWQALRPGSKSWNVFGDFGFDFTIDANPSQPKLCELVRKGIEVLENPNGFFIMCEGGKVDYACHANDAATNLRDIIALDDAVKVAVAWQKQHPDETLIIATGDHETGGLSMGFAGTGPQMKLELLAQQKVSCEKFSNDFKQMLKKRKLQVKFEEMLPQLKVSFGLDNLTDRELKILRQAFDDDVERVRRKTKDTRAHDVKRRYMFAQAAKNVLSARAGVGWACGSHTAMPAMTTATGVGAERFAKITQNTEIALALKELLAGNK